MTSAGHLTGGESRVKAGARGKGPTRVITDLGVLEPDPQTHELIVTALHPGITKEQMIAATGWELKFADKLQTTKAPTSQELQVLRDLNDRTALAHGSIASGD